LRLCKCTHAAAHPSIVRIVIVVLSSGKGLLYFIGFPDYTERLCEFFPGLLLSSSFSDSCFQILGRTLWMEYLCIETPMLAKNDINKGKMLACMHSFYYSDSNTR